MNTPNNHIEMDLADGRQSEPLPLRFQTNCPQCDELIWTDESRIGDKINCPACEAVLTVEEPPGPAPGLDALAVAIAESPEHRSPYSVLADSKLGPHSSAIDFFRAYHRDPETMKAIKRLREPIDRFAQDFLGYPLWLSEDSDHGLG